MGEALVYPQEGACAVRARRQEGRNAETTDRRRGRRPRRLALLCAGNAVLAVGVGRHAAEIGGFLDRPLGLLRDQAQRLVGTTAVAEHVACRLGQTEGLAIGDDDALFLQTLEE